MPYCCVVVKCRQPDLNLHLIMPNRCVVYGCGNVTDKKNGISVHCFPADKTVKRQWVKFVSTTRANFRKPKAGNTSTVICSQHFSADCFCVDETLLKQLKIDSGYQIRCPRLKSDAIPTISFQPIDGKRRLESGNRKAIDKMEINVLRSRKVPIRPDKPAITIHVPPSSQIPTIALERNAVTWGDLGHDLLGRGICACLQTDTNNKNTLLQTISAQCDVTNIKAEQMIEMNQLITTFKTEPSEYNSIFENATSEDIENVPEGTVVCQACKGFGFVETSTAAKAEQKELSGSTMDVTQYSHEQVEMVEETVPKSITIPTFDNILAPISCGQGSGPLELVPFLSNMLTCMDPESNIRFIASLHNYALPLTNTSQMEPNSGLLIGHVPTSDISDLVKEYLKEIQATMLQLYSSDSIQPEVADALQQLNFRLGILPLVKGLPSNKSFSSLNILEHVSKQIQEIVRKARLATKAQSALADGQPNELIEEESQCLSKVSPSEQCPESQVTVSTFSNYSSGTCSLMMTCCSSDSDESEVLDSDAEMPVQETLALAHDLVERSVSTVTENIDTAILVSTVTGNIDTAMPVSTGTGNIDTAIPVSAVTANYDDAIPLTTISGNDGSVIPVSTLTANLDGAMQMSTVSWMDNSAISMSTIPKNDDGLMQDEMATEGLANSEEIEYILSLDDEIEGAKAAKAALKDPDWSPPSVAGKVGCLSISSRSGDNNVEGSDVETDEEQRKRERRRLYQLEQRPKPPCGPRKDLKCAHCNYLTKQRRLLHAHERMVHDIQSSYRFACDLCGKRFRTHNCINYHCATDHGMDMPYTTDLCTICGRHFDYRHNYMRHIRSCTRKEPVKCLYEGCNIMLSSVDVRESHSRRIHLRKYEVGCPHKRCNMKCVTNSQLRKHIESKHLKLKPFSCTKDWCIKKFATKDSLTVHLRTHSSIPYLSCHYCNYACRQRNAMNWHMKKHPEESEESKTE